MDGPQQARSALRTFRGAADICKTALATPDPEGAIGAMLDGLVEGLGFVAARVVLPGDADAGGSRWRHAPDSPLPRFPALPVQMFEEAFRDGSSRRVASDDVPLPEGIASVLVLALRGAARSSGSLQLLAASADAFDDLTVELLACLAGQVAQVLDRQRLLRDAVESRDYLESLVHAAGDAIIATDIEGIIKRWNPAAERLFGFAASEAVGLPISHLWSPGEARAAERLLREVADGQGVRQQRSRRLHQDGHEIDVLLTLSPIRDVEGGVVGVSGIIRDLSHQIRLESRCEAMGHRASESEQKYRTLLQASPEAIFLLDPEALAIREVNPRACHLFGRTPRELVDRSLPELLEGDVAAAVRELRNAAGAHSHRPREIRIGDRQGKVRTLEIIASPVQCGGTSLLQVIGRDVTDRRQAEAEKEILQDRLIQSEKLSVMGELLSGVAHELNNPLTGVIGYAQLLRDGCGPEELERNLERIQEEARRCHRI
ncbi:MAG: PAS domain S-box protein, partial [Acidobacteriota bacterium]